MPPDPAAVQLVPAAEPNRPARSGAATTAFPRRTGTGNGYRAVQQLHRNADVCPRWPLVLIAVGSAILTAAVTTAIVLGVVWLFGA